MQRKTAIFLLLFALAGIFVPVALAATAAPPHACCTRKAHHCHQATALSEQAAFQAANCCRQDCRTASVPPQSPNPRVALAASFDPAVGNGVPEFRLVAPAIDLARTQSSRAPPNSFIA